MAKIKPSLAAVIAPLLVGLSLILVLLGGLSFSSSTVRADPSMHSGATGDRAVAFTPQNGIAGDTSDEPETLSPYHTPVFYNAMQNGWLNEDAPNAVPRLSDDTLPAGSAAPAMAGSHFRPPVFHDTRPTGIPAFTSLPPVPAPMPAATTASGPLNLSINYSHDWIQGPYAPGHTVWVTVTNSSGVLKAVAKMTTRSLPWGWEGFSTNDGNPWQPRRPDIQPGDWVHGAVSTGYTATVQVGRITGLVDVDADRITGTVDAPWLLPGPVQVECHPWGAPGGAPNKHTTVIPNGADVYTCAWDPNTEWDVGPGQDIGVSYREPAGHQVFGVFRSPHPILEVNYAHDWIEGNYEPGHTIWLTVTNDVGAVKATATLTTGVIPWWDGRTGFSTNLGEPWRPQRPDIQPGDHIHAAVSNGYTGAMQVGRITGWVSAATDTITGTVNAPWLLPGTIEVECHTWGAPRWTPNKWARILPNGTDVYTCAWDPLTEWDVLPGQHIGVTYRDRAGHQVRDEFYEPSYDLIFNINYAHDGVEGDYEPGYTVWVTVTNEIGEIKATATLTTGVIPWWGHRTGFSSHLDNPWHPQRPDLRPGDVVYGAVDNGYTAAVKIGRITGFTDVDADRITGTVSAPWLLPETVDVECHPWIGPDWAPNKSDRILPDGHEVYTCAWDPLTEWDMQLGKEIGVLYRDPARHQIFNVFRTADYRLLLTVNYEADRIEGPYEPGYTIWLTVTNAAGVTKATIELTTDDQGFSTDRGAWQPARPDIQPGDWVYGAVDNGVTAAMRVGEITGALDVATDQVTGTVRASWLLPGTVEVECFAWDAPDWIVHKKDSVTPDGSDPYTCAWDPDTEWNIRPGQNVAVAYYTPGGGRIVRLFSEPVVYDLDAIVVKMEPSVTNAIARLESGEFSIYAQDISDPAIVQQIADSPNLDGYLSYGRYNELTFNPSGPIFARTGKLNPFAAPRVREAVNWLVNREHIRQNIMGGMSMPRFHPLNIASPDYADLADVARALEREYAYDKTLAQQVIAQEMLKLGATRIGGKWYYNGEPVEIILLIRVEDKRRQIGDYVADQLESIGFTVVRDYKTAAQASPIWLRGDPADGRFHIYTGGWITTQAPRDLAENFAFFYTNMGLSLPLWQAYNPKLEFYELARKLRGREFSTFAQRRAMMAQALDWALEDSVRVWLHDQLSITPRRTEVRYASGLYGGMWGSWLWPHTLTRTGVFTTPLTIGSPSVLYQPWNPLSGSNWDYDPTFFRATADQGAIPDPYNGLVWPQRIISATVVARSGLPVTRTLNWVTLQFTPTIVVPADAWVDWDAGDQRFITRGERYSQGLTATVKSVVYYPANFTTNVTWHDGSPFSVADVVLHMILAFDRDLTDIRGVRIISQNPLVIETYSDAYQIDAELNVRTWWPYYNTGPGAWHNLALGLLVEEAREGAFSQQQANEWGVPWLDYVAWPGMVPLERKLATARAANYIPYSPTLGAYITPQEAQARWNNLANWYEQRGHFWIGTGPFYLEHALKPLGELSLKPYLAYPDPPDRWAAFTDPPLAQAAITGPDSVSQGAGATFTVSVSLAGQPYPAADINSVRYLLYNAQGAIAFTGTATVVQDGLWRITLTPEMSAQLPQGLNQLEVAVTSKRIVLPTFASHFFETTGLQVLGVAPNSGVNTATTPITITGQHFQAEAVAALLRGGTAYTLTTTYVSAATLQATVPAGLPPGTYDLRVVNPGGRSHTLLAAFTVLSPAPPTLAGVDPPQGPNHIPVTVDIYGSNFAPGITATLSGSGGVYPLEAAAFIHSGRMRASVPMLITPGVYTLTVSNPNGQSALLPNAYTALEGIDDLIPRAGSFWLAPATVRRGDPVTPTLGIVVNRLGGIHPIPEVLVDFYYQPAGGGMLYIGRAGAPALPPDGQAATAPLAWANLPPAGTYTLYAIVDPQNAVTETVEVNNTITRTVIILPPLPDTIPPVVQNLRINDGEPQTDRRQVVFNVTAQDNPGGSGIAHLLYAEYVYIRSRGDWAPVATSGWLPYAEASTNYPWLLSPDPGVHYIRVWAADAAGNISLYWRAAFINLVPETDPASIARGHVHTYRFYLQNGQNLTATLTSVTGDTDIYVFDPTDTLLTYSFLTAPVEGVNFTAARNGPFQVETYGFTAGQYTLQFRVPFGLQAQGWVGQTSGKEPRTQPQVSAEASPAEEEYVTGVPSAPAIVQRKVYLPLVTRAHQPSVEP